MRILKWGLLAVLVMVLLAASGTYGYLRYSEPAYSGEQKLAGLQEEVEVLYDGYGIPHIYAQNEEDLYFALGYVTAQERLFQMEMTRRLATGRLAEILGPDLVKIDVLFRTLGLTEAAKEAVSSYLSSDEDPYQKAALAYIKGINSYISKGPLPPEFSLLGIPREPFVPEDLYHILGYMSYSFANAYKEDPLIDRVLKEYGQDYLKDWVTHHAPGLQTIPVYMEGDSLSAVAEEVTAVREKAPVWEPQLQMPGLAAEFDFLMDFLPVPLFQGSNSWVIGQEKTASGHVILANDPHIGFSQPAVWFEAHLEAPNYSFYGHHIAGCPFGLVGHTRSHAWGLTMLESDDMDFFQERLNPDSPDQVWATDHWENLQIREELIHVKGEKDTIIHVRSSRHGPLVSGVFEQLPDSLPLAMSWTYLKEPSSNLANLYDMSHAQELVQVQEAVGRITAPGLNVMYGDKEGNIAWWAAGRYTRYPEYVDTKHILDGASGADEPLGLYPFAENPRSVNPPDGFVYSANNQPDTTLGRLYPGYYLPEGRARRIYDWLKGKDLWTVDEVKVMIADTRSIAQVEMAASILEVIATDSSALEGPQRQAVQLLAKWNGDHGTEEVGPTIFQRWTYYIQRMAMEDELGIADFEAAVSGFLLRRTLPLILKNDSSLWWDDLRTSGKVETRREIFLAALEQATLQLTGQLGSDATTWHWGKVHTLTHGHPLGRVAPLDQVFNVGGSPAPGGNDVINCIGSRIDSTGLYRASYGPSKRRIVNFEDLEHSFCVLPTGNSGHFLSEHYADQADMYLRGEFRLMLMNRLEIEAEQGGQCVLKPGE